MAWEARQGGTGPQQSPSALRAGARLGAARRSGAALNGSTGMEVPSRGIHPQPSVGEGMKEYAHKRGHAAAGRPQQMLSTAVRVPPSSYIATTDLPPAHCLTAHLTQTKSPLS